MTDREKEELYLKLDEASNEDLGKLAKYALRLKSDPFEAGRRRLELPSVTRETVLKALKASIKNNTVPVAKMNP